VRRMTLGLREGTPTRNRLRINARRDRPDWLGMRVTAINRFVGSTAFGAIMGRQVDVEAGVLMSGDGYVGRLNIHDVAGQIVMPGAAPRGVVIRANHLEPGTDVMLPNTGLRRMQVRGWSGSSLHAQWAGAILARRAWPRGIAGSFGADIVLTGEGVPAGDHVLRSFRADNELNGSWAIAGPVGRIAAGSINSDWEAEIEGSVRSLTSRGRAGGMFHALSLGVLRTGESLEDAEIRTGQSIGRVSVKAMRNVTLFAGVRDDLAELPASAGDFVGPGSISRVMVRGAHGMDSFVNSNIAAATLGSLSLNRVMLGNGGVDFGVAGESIGQVRFRVDGTSFRFPADAPPAGDFQIRDL